MNRLSVIAVVGFLGVLVYVAGDLLDPDPVPVAAAVELEGNVPEQPRPTPDGFFIIPPRVVDLRQTGETDDGDGGQVSDEQGADDSLDRDGADDLGGDPDDSPDDSPDDLGDEGDDPDDD